MRRWLEIHGLAACLRPTRKCGEFRVSGIRGRTCGAFEGIDSIVMSETEGVKVFPVSPHGLFWQESEGGRVHVDLGIFDGVYTVSDPSLIGPISGARNRSQDVSIEGFPDFWPTKNIDIFLALDKHSFTFRFFVILRR